MVLWNVRGVKSPHKQMDVEKNLSMKFVGLVCLLETKVNAANMGCLY